MRTLVAGDAASSLGTCSKLLSHGRVIYQIGIFDASEKIRKFKFVKIRFYVRPLISGTMVSGSGIPRLALSLCRSHHHQASCAGQERTDQEFL